MKQKVVAQKVLKELIDLKIVEQDDEEIMWAYLLMVYSAGFNEGKIQRGRERPVLQMRRDGTPIKVHQSLKFAANAMQLDVATIGRALRGKVVTAGGFKWKYIDNESK
jgi:hypothetical protein